MRSDIMQRRAYFLLLDDDGGRVEDDTCASTQVASTGGTAEWRRQCSWYWPFFLRSGALRLWLSTRQSCGTLESSFEEALGFSLSGSLLIEEKLA